jgi:hypothetical protein
MARCENRSKRPPKKPISAPVSVPTSTPITVSAMPNSTDTRKPYSSRARMSRPRSSVPSQFSADGGAGLGSLAK